MCKRLINKILDYSKSALVFIFISSWSCCKKDSNSVPVVYTDIYLYTTEPAFAPLNAISGYTYIEGGSKGLLIYRKSQTEFLAYDRHCTYKVENSNSVTMDASGLLAVDSSCGSKFLITDGSTNQGPAVNPLKQYQVAFNGTVLHVYN
jgi:nitrite reductase/ring-hydroxylating ferredoxin subunit